MHAPLSSLPMSEAHHHTVYKDKGRQPGGLLESRPGEGQSHGKGHRLLWDKAACGGVTRFDVPLKVKM